VTDAETLRAMLTRAGVRWRTVKAAAWEEPCVEKIEASSVGQFRTRPGDPFTADELIVAVGESGGIFMFNDQGALVGVDGWYND